MQAYAIIHRQQSAQLLQPRHKVIARAEEDEGIFRDGRVHLDGDVFIEDQRNQPLLMGNRVLDQLVAELAFG